MKILNKEIDFDFFDAKQMEKFEKEAIIVQEKLNNINTKNMKQSEFINKICAVIEECFNNVFGEKTSEKIFEGKKNFRLCMKAFNDLVKAKKEQEEQIENEIEKFKEDIKEMDKEYKILRKNN